jgi:hypothetical protein
MTELREAAHPTGIGFTTTCVSAKRRCATLGNDTVVSFSDPAFRDELSELVRHGARRFTAILRLRPSTFRSQVEAAVST